MEYAATNADENVSPPSALADKSNNRGKNRPTKGGGNGRGAAGYNKGQQQQQQVGGGHDQELEEALLEDSLGEVVSGTGGGGVGRIVNGSGGMSESSSSVSFASPSRRGLKGSKHQAMVSSLFVADDVQLTTEGG
jgi:hypothetical protein